MFNSLLCPHGDIISVSRQSESLYSFLDEFHSKNLIVSETVNPILLDASVDSVAALVLNQIIDWTLLSNSRIRSGHNYQHCFLSSPKSKSTEMFQLRRA